MKSLIYTLIFLFWGDLYSVWKYSIKKKSIWAKYIRILKPVAPNYIIYIIEKQPLLTMLYLEKLK